MDTADHLRDASPWQGKPSAVKRAILGKLAEELGELQAAIGRCIIQGVHEAHPVTGKPNLEWLLEELADVENMANFVKSYTAYNRDEYGRRVDRKSRHIAQWLEQIAPLVVHPLSCPANASAVCSTPEGCRKIGKCRLTPT